MKSTSLHPPRMRRPWRALFVLLPLATIAAQPGSVTADDLTISSIWARATATGTTVGAVYFNVENRGRQLDTLLRASSPVATEVTFHRTTVHDGVSQMDQLWSVDIAPGRTMKFEPGGRHVMLTGLKQPLVAGTRMPVTLQFQHAGAVTLQVEVLPVTAAGPAAGDAAMAHDHPAH